MNECFFLLQDIKTLTFSVTPVFFNVGINEKATLADKLGLNGPQEKNNSDNFKILADFVRRYKKMNLFSTQMERKSNNLSKKSINHILKECTVHLGIKEKSFFYLST